MTRKRDLLAGVVLALLGTAVSIGALEAGVRLLHLVPDRLWVPDSELGARLAPNASGWWTQEDREFVVPVHTNAHGLRDVEHSFEKPQGVLRILVLGDSFVEAMHVPQEAVFTRQLETQLNGATRRVEVIGAGVSGYGTAGELLYFRRDGRRFHPDLVVLSLYPGNDVKNNSPTLEETLKPVFGADGSIDHIENVKTTTGAPAEPSSRPRSKALQFLRQLILVRHPGLAERLVDLGLMKKEAIRKPPQRDGVPVDFGVYAEPVSSEWEDAWLHTEQLLDELRREVLAAGAHFAVMIVSSRDQVYPASWQRILADNPAMQGRTWDLDAPQRRVEAWCRNHAVPFVAMAPAFKAAVAAGSEPLHYAHDGHWTEAGHRLAAAKLADFVLANSMLNPEQEGVDR